MKLCRLLIPGLFLLASAVWLLPLAACPTCVPFQPGLDYSDLLISHWPNAEFLNRALGEWNQLPLWNPTILSGAPFAADPLAGLWYPVNWLLLFLPLSFGFNLLVWLHLAWAGWGMFRLLRTEGAGVPAALLGGIAFGGLPKLVGHAGLGHVSLVMAVSWTPWVLLSARAACEKRRPRDVALAGSSLGLVFLIDARWALPAGLLALAFAARCLSHSHKTNPLRWKQAGVGAGLAGVFAAGMAAVLALPMWEFARLSTRMGLSGAEQDVLSLPAGHLFGLLLPDAGGYGEWLVYGGAGVLVLALVALVSARPGWGFWGSIASLALILALGSKTPLYSVFSAIVPGFSLLRVPSRWLFVFGLAMSALAGMGVEALLRKDLAEATLRRLRLVLAGLGAFFLLLGTGIVVVGVRGVDVPWAAWTLAAGIGLLSVIMAWICLAKDLRPALAAAGWVLLAVVDLGWMNASLIEARALQEPDQPPAILAGVDAGAGRIFSPSYSVPQHIASRQGLELADGVNPLQLASYRDFMAEATGFSVEAYSVTLPPFPGGDPAEDWSPQIDAKLLGLLNVSWVVSAFPIETEGLSLETVMHGEYLYRNALARPRAWVEETQGLDSPWTAAEIVRWSPNRIHVRARGPGRLVLSEIEYPGWLAELDGERTDLEAAYGTLRAVDIPAGEHEVVFSMRSSLMFLGGVLTLATLVSMAALRWRR